MLRPWMACYHSLNKKCLRLADFCQDFYYQVPFDMLPKLTPSLLAAHLESSNVTSM